MRIAMDIRPLRDVMTGIGRYIFKLLHALEKCDKENEYRLFWSNFKRPAPDCLPVAHNFKQVSLRLPGKAITALWAYTSFPRAEFLTGEIDVFHAPGFQVPPTRCAATVFTIYDLIPITHPQMAIPSAVRHIRPRMSHYVKRADLIVAISQATARELAGHFDVSGQKISVVYPGATLLSKASPQEIALTLAKFGLRNGYILFVSRLDPRKNLSRIIKAYELAGLAADFELVIVGPEGWHMEEMLITWQSSKFQDRIRWLKYVTDVELRTLYSGATFFVYPSLIEGFGLPILEAMSAGCPVLTSNTSSMPEVAGDAARYVDPVNVESIAEGMVELASDAALRARLIESGYQRLPLFTWENTAMEMIKVYKRAFEIKVAKRGR